jgi:hypothetical protein
VLALGPRCPPPQSPRTHTHTTTKARNVRCLDLSFSLFIEFTPHSPPSCPVSDDDASAWWAWWPTARLRWRTCSSCAHGRRCRSRMMRRLLVTVVSVFSASCSEGLRSACSSELHGYCVWRARRLAWCSLALSHCSVSAVRTPSMRSFDAPTPALVSILTFCVPAERMYCRK